MVKTRLFPVETTFTLNITSKNQYHGAKYVWEKRFWIPEPVEVEFKPFLSYGEDYENFWDFYINLKNKNFKIKLELCKLKKTLYIAKLWKDEKNDWGNNVILDLIM